MPAAERHPARCPVCTTPGPAEFGLFGERRYWRCPTCAARWLDPIHHLGRAAEHAHYLTHENDPGDPGYRAFLARLANPLLDRLPPGAQGLDYGCGPGPALARMIEEAGHSMALYDPIFHADTTALQDRYDFVTCTEVAEHFHHPAQEFERLFGLVRPGGWLVVMTCFQTEDSRFENWRYRKDPTHVVFYRAQTLRHLAERQGWRCDIPVKDVALMQRPAATT